MKEIEGNLLDITRGIIVHGCNCQGVMGSGVALAVKTKYKEVFKAYSNTEPALGRVVICTSVIDDVCEKYKMWVDQTLPKELYIVNALTQNSYGSDGKRYVDYDAISACFYQVKMVAKELKLPVYFPLIGAGLGGGDWAEISKRIDQVLGDEVEGILVKLPKVENL